MSVQRLLASDFDGTLCRSFQQITDRDRKAVHSFIQDHVFGIVSGRDPRSLQAACRQLQIPYHFLITYGGGAAFDAEGNMLFQHTLSDDLRDMIDVLCARASLLVAVYGRDRVWMQINGHEEMCDRYVQTIRSLYPLVDHPSDIDAICIISAECQSAQEAEQLAAFIANRYPQAQTAVNRNSIDISAKGVNKATALSAIARHFHIDPSQVAAIGDGRNDLCLLEHFYEPQEGTVSLGGVPVADIPLQALRGRMGYVQQGADIFSGTVREALTYGLHREVPDEEIWEAARKTGFAEILEKWDAGLDTPVAPGGTSMSGGQRQKLVLTREFMRGADVLLFDEPTSALDAAAARMVQDTIFDTFPDQTKIIVTHDLSLIRRVDQIIVLDRGVLAGCGSYNDLYGKCGAFMELIAACQAEKEAAQC